MAARNRGAKVGFGKVTPDASVKYGTPEEIDARDAGPGAHPAQTSFRQLSGEQGGDASNPTFKHVGGDYKFTKGA